MRRWLIGLTLILFALVLLYPVVLALITLASPTPGTVGTGRMKRCPETPNCVSSLSGERPDALVLPLSYTGETYIAQALLMEILEDMPRTQIMIDYDGYIHAEKRSAVFRFVDDLEFQFDESGKEIHVRSAARLGYSDMDVNRRTVESIREQFNEKIR